MFGGVLFKLVWKSGICPCLVKEEDQNARQSLQHVNEVGKRILWYTKDPSSSSKGVSLGGMSFSLGGLFGGGGSSSVGSGTAGGSSHGSSSGDDDDAVEAVFRLQDNSEGGHPEIFVDPIPRRRQQVGAEEGEAGGGGSSKSVGYKLNIALKRVDRVQADPHSGLITLVAKPPKDPGPGGSRLPPKELLRFAVLQQNTSNDESVRVKDDERNLFVHHLSVLVEWERQRRIEAAKNGEDVDDDEDEDDRDHPNFLQARARKAAHFAKREIEMKKTKREREKRKAKLVSETGGLKYTAIAMATRAAEGDS